MPGTVNMGKVREDTMAKPSAGDGGKPTGANKPGRSRAVVGFVGNLLRADRYKPTQGKKARLWTALGLAAVVAAGLSTFYNTVLGETTLLVRFNTTVALGLLAAWLIWRAVEYPPFADFLVATEAEMNKVSWTNWDDLKRATVVVLATVLIISLFLLGVDVLWSKLLQLIGVLHFDGSGGFGSQAG
jgi:preprotein translocase subunit SecE